MWHLLIWVGITIRALNFLRMRSNISAQYDHRRELKATFTEVWYHRSQKTMSLLPIVQLTKQNISDEYRKIFFVHIGKAGGETIKQILAVGCQSMLNRRRRSNCFQQVPPSNLSNHVYGYYHCYQLHTRKGFRKAQTNNATLFNTYLFNLRHPVERIQSWYNYVHPKHCIRKNNIQDMINPSVDTMSQIELNGASSMTKKRRRRSKQVGLSCEAHRQSIDDPAGFVAMFFHKCFPTLDDWANAIQNAQNGSKRSPWSAQCLQLALDSIQGNLDRHEATIATHLMANYEHYMNRTIRQHPEKDVMVVRIHHLWTDLQYIDRRYFHGTGDFGNLTGTAFTHGSHSPGGNQTAISLQSQQIFCCALRSELLLYRELLLRAINLRPTDQSASLQHAMDICGFATWDQMRICRYYS
jgi:Sulfotransferase family